MTEDLVFFYFSQLIYCFSLKKKVSYKWRGGVGGGGE